MTHRRRARSEPSLSVPTDLANLPHFLGCALILCASTYSAHAVDSADQFVHWAYSAYFGTGWYQVGDRQDAFVIRTAPRWRFENVAVENESALQIDVEVRLPLTLGLHDLDASDLSETLNVNNFATASLTPGIEIHVPVNRNWTLKPYVYAGLGTELGAEENAWIYWAGLKSRYRFLNDSWQWSLLNSIGYLGYTTDDDNSSDTFPVMAGLTLATPAGPEFFGDQSYVFHWHTTYTAYLGKLDFRLGRLPDTLIAGEWEVGVAISKATERISLGSLEFDRLGIAYRFSDDGDFEGVSLEFRSVFDR